MTRHIDPSKRLVQEFHPGQPQLPVDKLIVQYTRQSTIRQVKKNKQSAILQDIKLTRRLLAYGWPDESINLDSTPRNDTAGFWRSQEKLKEDN